MSHNFALDEALSQLSAQNTKSSKGGGGSSSSDTSSSAQKSQSPQKQRTATTTTASNSTSPYALLRTPSSPQQYYEEALPPDNLVANEQRTTVHMLSTRFKALCSRVLPFGNVGELELQVLSLTSTGYVAEPNIWLQKSRMTREFSRCWYERLRAVHSEPHRALHTLTKVALILSYFDKFASSLLDADDSTKSTSNSSKRQKQKQKKSPREKARTAAEVIASAHVSRKDALELAVWFQDSVCNPGEGDIISKRESANLFETFAREGNLPDADRCRISRIIRHTAIFSSEKNSKSKETKIKSTSPKPTSTSLFSSFDVDTAMLRSFNRIFLFGGLRSVHCDRSHRLRLEYRHLPDMKWCKRRAGVLREYLSLKRLLEPNGGSIWMKSGDLRDQVEREMHRNLQYEIDCLRSGELPGYENIMKDAGGPILPLLDLPRYMDGGSRQVYVTPIIDGSEESGGTGGAGSLTRSSGGVGGTPIASSISHCVIVPGGRTLRKICPVPVVYYVLSGIGEVFRGGRVDRIQKNDTVNVRANTVHYFMNRHGQQELYMLIIGSLVSAAVLE
jgi:predicted metal-dependent HD superfamily phosphohydrolase